MSLWPGYYAHGIDKCPEPILTEIPKINMYADVGEGTEVSTLFGRVFYFPGKSIRTANANVSYEDFPPKESVTWHINKDIAMIVLDGTADLKYTLYGSGMREWKYMSIKKGDAYIVPNGAVVEWKVTSDSRLRQIIITMPGV